MTTSPGFSSRSSQSITKQFPQRDEAGMSETEKEAGWSNSEPVEDAPHDVAVEVAEPEELEPGFSNAKAVRNDEEPDEEPAPDSDDEPEKAAVKKTAAKKAPAKKKG